MAKYTNIFTFLFSCNCPPKERVMSEASERGKLKVKRIVAKINVGRAFLSM